MIGGLLCPKQWWCLEFTCLWLAPVLFWCQGSPRVWLLIFQETESCRQVSPVPKGTGWRWSCLCCTAPPASPLAWCLTLSVSMWPRTAIFWGKTANIWQCDTLDNAWPGVNLKRDTLHQSPGRPGQGSGNHGTGIPSQEVAASAWYD